MARDKWAVYDAGGVPVMLVTGTEDIATGNKPEGGTVKKVDSSVMWLEQVPPLEDDDAETD